MDLENAVIDVLNRNTLKLFKVVTEQKSKLQVADESGKRERVNPRHVITVIERNCQGEPSECLNRHQKIIEQLREEVDVELLWETLKEEETRTFQLEELADHFFGENEPAQCAALARELLANSVFFKNDKAEFTLRGPDEVAELKERERKAAERKAKKEAALNAFDLIMKEQFNREQDEDENMAGVIREMRDYLLRGQCSHVIRLLRDFRPGKNPRETALKLLRKLNELPQDAEDTLLLNGIIADFPATVEAHAQELTSYTRDPDRIDCTHLQPVSIDDSDTLEIDDAVSLEPCEDGYELGIHIADPSVFVEKEDVVDKVAAERPLTLYLPTVTVEMLPKNIGCNLASLNAEELRPSFSFFVRFDTEGRMTDWRLEPAEIKVGKRLTYDDVDSLIEQRDHDELGQKLHVIQQLTDRLREEREQNGALRLLRPELKVKVEEGEVNLKVLDTSSPSRNLVSECMILANRLAAEFALRNDIPIIYRNQPEPPSRIPLMEAYDPVRFINSVRQLKRSQMSTQPEKHAGLGLDVYTQASSPLRRYADLVMQRQFVAYLKGQPFPYSVEELIAVLGEAERIEGQNKRLEREVSQYWTLEYVRRNLMDEELSAIVLPAGRNGQEAMIEEWNIQGALVKGVKMKPGTKINVTVGNVKPKQNLLVLKPV